MAGVEEVEVVVAHHERATLRAGDVFVKIDADQPRTGEIASQFDGECDGRRDNFDSPLNGSRLPAKQAIFPILAARPGPCPIRSRQGQPRPPII